MDNNNENFDNEFVKSSSNSNYTKVSSNKEKDRFFLKSIFLPFVFGIVGASLILCICFFIPNVKNLFISNDDKESIVEKIFTSSGPVNSGVDISEYSDTAIAVANKVLPSVVGIEVDFSVSANYPTFSAASQSATSQATGSGVIISSDGYILTNNHVVDTSSSSSNDSVPFF